MTRYKTLWEVFGINADDVFTLTDFFNRVVSIHSDTLNLANNVLDKGFLNPGEDAYYYGVGAAAAKIQANIDRLDLIFPENRLLERFTSFGMLDRVDTHYTKISVQPQSSLSIDMLFKPFHTYAEDDQYSKAKLLALTDGDADYNHIYGFVPIVKLADWQSVGLITADQVDAIKTKYGSESKSRGQVALLSNIDISTFLFTLMLTLSHRNTNSESIVEICNSPSFRRLGGLNIPYRSWNFGAPGAQDMTFNPGVNTSYKVHYTDRSNLILMYSVGTSQVGTTQYEANEGGIISPIANDVWLSAFMLKMCLMQFNVDSVAGLLNNIQSLSQDFAQASFDDSASDSDMYNWVYNYINMNFPSNTCTASLKRGQTKISSLDPLASAFN